MKLTPVDYAAVLPACAQGTAGEEKLNLRLLPTSGEGLAPPHRSLNFPVTTEPNHTKLRSIIFLQWRQERTARKKEGSSLRVSSDMSLVMGGGSDTGCSLNRNQLPLEETHYLLGLQVGNFGGCAKRGPRGILVSR